MDGWLHLLLQVTRTAGGLALAAAAAGILLPQTNQIQEADFAARDVNLQDFGWQDPILQNTPEAIIAEYFESVFDRGSMEEINADVEAIRNWCWDNYGQVLSLQNQQIEEIINTQREDQRNQFLTKTMERRFGQKTHDIAIDDVLGLTEDICHVFESKTKKVQFRLDFEEFKRSGCRTLDFVSCFYHAAGVFALRYRKYENYDAIYKVYSKNIMDFLSRLASLEKCSNKIGSTYLGIAIDAALWQIENSCPEHNWRNLNYKTPMPRIKADLIALLSNILRSGTPLLPESLRHAYLSENAEKLKAEEMTFVELIKKTLDPSVHKDIRDGYRRAFVLLVHTRPFEAVRQILTVYFATPETQDDQVNSILYKFVQEVRKIYPVPDVTIQIGDHVLKNIFANMWSDVERFKLAAAFAGLHSAGYAGLRCPKTLGCDYKELLENWHVLPSCYRIPLQYIMQVYFLSEPRRGSQAPIEWFVDLTGLEEVDDVDRPSAVTSKLNRGGKYAVDFAAALGPYCNSHRTVTTKETVADDRGGERLKEAPSISKNLITSRDQTSSYAAGNLIVSEDAQYSKNRPKNRPEKRNTAATTPHSNDSTSASAGPLDVIRSKRYSQNRPEKRNTAATGTPRSNDSTLSPSASASVIRRVPKTYSPTRPGSSMTLCPALYNNSASETK